MRRVPFLFDINAGLIVSINIIISCLTSAALILTGPLQGYIPNAVILFLLPSAIISLIILCFTKLPLAIATSSSQVVAIFAIMSSHIVSVSQLQPGAQETVFLIFFMMSVATVIIGLTFFLLGYFHLGKAVRYIPYPVSTSFLAGTGWIIFKGAFSMLLGVPITIHVLTKVMTYMQLKLMIISVCIGLMIYFLTKKFRSSLILPACLIVLISIFYLFLYLSHISIAQATQMGLMLPPLTTSQNIHWFMPIFMPQAISHYDIIIKFYPLVLIIILISAITFLFNLTSLELLNNKEIDANKELQFIGLSNILVGSLGWFVSSPSLSNSILAKRAKGQTKFTSIVVIIIIFAVCFFAMPYVVFFPKILLSALLVFFGTSVIFDFLISNWHKLSNYEYFLAVFIVIVIAAFGIILGIIAGIIMATALFAYDYSRVSVVKNVIRGEVLHSNTQRSYKADCYLEELRNQILYLKLHQYIFFGSANNLFEEIKEYLMHKKKDTIKFLIIDFTLVTGIDSSAISFIFRISQNCLLYRVYLIFTNLKDRFATIFWRWNIIKIEGGFIKRFKNNDMALEWCENKLLKDAPNDYYLTDSLKDYLKRWLSNEKDIENFLSYTQKLILKKENYLFCEGDIADSLYFLSAGEIAIKMAKKDKHSEYLRKISPINIIGEMGLYTKKERVASAIATKDCVIYKLSFSSMKKMRIKDSNLAAALDLLVVTVLSERIGYLDKQVKSLF